MARGGDAGGEGSCFYTNVGKVTRVHGRIRILVTRQTMLLPRSVLLMSRVCA